MNIENALFQFYQQRLVRRELTLLITYRQQGRVPRISQFAYWRASFAPLIIGLTFFGARAFGLMELQSTMVACSLLIGLVLADMQLFVMNAGTWIFAKRALNWLRVGELAEVYLGIRKDLSKSGDQNRWDQIQVAPAYLKGLAQTYEKLKSSPPSLNQVFFQSAEGRSLLFMTGIAALFATLQSDFVGVILSIYMFFAAWPAKRLKAAVDFHVTWPILQDVFDWSQIRAMTGKL